MVGVEEDLGWEVSAVDVREGGREGGRAEWKMRLGYVMVFAIEDIEGV